MSKYKEIDLSGLKRYSIRDRESKVDTSFFAQTGKVDTSAFLNCLPRILKADELRDLIAKTQQARAKGKPIIIGLGGHVIKCGLAPLLIEMMASGYVSGFVTNGSVAIHDFEIAMHGQTSEDVASALADGSFGMAIETCDGINAIVNTAAAQGKGYGEAIGEYLAKSAVNKELSLFAQAHAHSIPVCVQVALGTDISHQHLSADGAAIGECSLRDFRILCNLVKDLNDGGVFINFGSAVIIPEVFLKALTVARNLSGSVDNITTAVFDMNMHYRPSENIVKRPTITAGNGYYFVGHHEIMIPLFIKSLIS